MVELGVARVLADLAQDLREVAEDVCVVRCERLAGGDDNTHHSCDERVSAAVGVSTGRRGPTLHQVVVGSDELGGGAALDEEEEGVEDRLSVWPNVDLVEPTGAASERNGAVLDLERAMARSSITFFPHSH